MDLKCIAPVVVPLDLEIALIDALTGHKKVEFARDTLVQLIPNTPYWFDTSTKDIVVFDECGIYEVGRTCYPVCAIAMVDAYVKRYLD